ncbi:MAG TPA: MFS transporter, partial [Paracoccaceae bacterium]|nr:MFS transporter [Paracoccaceae bacterium]
VVMPALLRRLSLAGLLFGAALAAALLLLLMRVFDGYWAWIVLRAAMSFATTALFFGSELWILTTAPAARRGTWLGIYGFFLALGFFVGPALLNLVGTAGGAPFVWGAGIMASAALPVMAAWARAPSGLGAQRQSLGTTVGFFRTDPALACGVLLFSCFEFGALGLLPVWGLRVGYEESLAIFLVAAVAFSGLLFDLPMGMLSDRVNRRLLLVTAALAVLAAGLLLPSAAPFPGWVLLLLVVSGGLSIALYVVPLAQFATRYEGPHLAQANGAVMFAYGLGALISPVFLGQLMDRVPPHGLPLGLAGLAAAYLALILARRTI